MENHFEQGALSANINSAKDSTISVGVRDYKPGDRFSWIDWKATARTNNIMTKEFEQQRSHNVMIFIDRTESLFESVVTFTASIVRGCLETKFTSIIRVYRKRTNYLPFRQWRYAVTTNPLSFSKSASRQCIPALPECRHGTKKIYEPVTVILVTSNLSPDIQKAADCAAIKNRKCMVLS